VKLNALVAWRYTSDLFNFDQMLQQTMHGRFGLEYTYGNMFGDHAYLSLLVLVPVKAFAGAGMAGILLLCGPLAFVLGLVAFLATSEATDPLAAAAVSMVMLLHLGLGQGLLEITYGFAPDIVSGFAAMAMAAALDALLERRTTISRGVRGVFIVSALVFLLTKEEMALLGILFFGVLALDRRARAWRRSALGWLAASAAILIGDFLLIRICQSPWNRTDLALLHGLLDRAWSGELALLLRSSDARPYLIFAAGSLLSFATVCVLADRVQPVAWALAAMGLAKLAFSLSVSDFDLASWHNYPAVVMLMGAVFIQWRAARSRDVAASKRRLAALFVYVLLLVEIIGAATVDGPWLWQKWQRDRLHRALVAAWSGEISWLQSHMERSRVVSIEPETATAWSGGFRVAFFPRGVSESPIGIADYVVLWRRSAATSQLSEFAMLASTPSFTLFQRVNLAPSRRVCRRRFVERFGASAIGVDSPAGGQYLVPAGQTKSGRLP
jgi:hypothetical protein